MDASVTLTSSAIPASRKVRLIQIMIEGDGYKRGEYTLASGQKSKFYFNGKTITLNPEGISLVAEEIYDRIKGLEQLDSIGGLEEGAIPIATAVAQLSRSRAKTEEGKLVPAFWVRREKKDHGDHTKVEGTLDPESHVVIVDDVATRGTSIQEAVDEVESRKCKIVKIIVLLDRGAGARDRFKDKYVYESILTKSDFDEYLEASK